MIKIQRLVNGKQYVAALQLAEREIFLQAYRDSEYNQNLTARLLGVSRGTLRSRLKQWGEL